MSEKFRFDSPVVLVGGADVNPSLLRRLAHLPLIAADGGANHLRHSSLVPQLVIGDLDSVTDKDHRIIHRQTPPMTIPQLRDRIQNQQRKRMR